METLSLLNVQAEHVVFVFFIRKMYYGCNIYLSFASSEQLPFSILHPKNGMRCDAVDSCIARCFQIWSGYVWRL